MIKGCNNLSRCMNGACRIISLLQPKWNPNDTGNVDRQTLTRRQKQKNSEDWERDKEVTFDPSMTNSNSLASLFRVFGKDGSSRTQAAKRDQTTVNKRYKPIQVYTDDLCDKNGCDNARAASGV